MVGASVIRTYRTPPPPPPPMPLLRTLALVTGGYALASAIGTVTGRLRIARSGVLIGNQGRQFAMSDTTRGAPRRILGISGRDPYNALLFLLIGLWEVLVVAFTRRLAFSRVWWPSEEFYSPDGCRLGAPGPAMSHGRVFRPALWPS